MENRGTPGSKVGKNQVSEGGEGQGATDSVALGDVIYIRLRGGSWWPAQVVDDNSVHESIKPGKRSPGDVLVRLYGSYQYMYADPVKCRSKFEKILKSNNGSLRKILEQALEQNLPSTKSSRSKGSSSKTKGTPSKSNTSKRKSNKQDEEKKKIKRGKKKETLNNDDLGGGQSHEASLGKPQELSSRRIRVMESLGLIPPPGSPFQKNGHIYNKSS